MDPGDKRDNRLSRWWPVALLAVILGIAAVSSHVINTAEQEKQEQLASRSHRPMSRETREYIESLLADESSDDVEAEEEHDPPDRAALSERSDVKPLPPMDVDPGDYDDPEDYADDAESYFAYKGSADPWNDAYNHWEAVAS